MAQQIHENDSDHTVPTKNAIRILGVVKVVSLAKVCDPELLP